jgi:hypothetical protein
MKFEPVRTFASQIPYTNSSASTGFHHSSMESNYKVTSPADRFNLFIYGLFNNGIGMIYSVLLGGRVSYIVSE